VFVWVFHRISGLLLILFLAIQIFTGVYQSGNPSGDLFGTFQDLHKHTWLNCLLVFLVIFHALYGIRTILMDLGVCREKMLFWACTGVGSVLYAVFLILFLKLVAA